MPNWCENALTIKGDWKGFKEKMGEEFKLETFLPTPEPEKALEDSKDCWLRNIMVSEKPVPPDESLGAAWYYWRVQHWGTKWDVQVRGMDDTGEDLLIGFDSAWSPPSAAILGISAQFPELEFILEHLEMSMDFCGIETFKNGAVARVIEGVPSNKDYDIFPLLANMQAAIEEWELEGIEWAAKDEAKKNQGDLSTN